MSARKIETLIVPLTVEQQAAIEKFMDAARQADADGAPGMVLGQIFSDHMYVGFMPHARAKAMSLSGRKIRTAYDIEDES